MAWGDSFQPAPPRVHASVHALRERDAPASPTTSFYAGPHSVRIDAAPSDFASSSLEEAMDDNTLLAETEELLAILDASAFTGGAAVTLMRGDTRATRASVGEEEGAQGSVPAQPAGPPPPSSPSPPPMSTATATVAAKKSAVSTDPRLEKLRQLRIDVAKLEVELLLLRQQKHAVVLVRDRRKQIWQELAARQRRLRQLAEAENQQLKRMMHDFLASRDPRDFGEYLGLSGDVQLPNLFHGPWKRAITSSASRDSDLSGVFEPLLRRLDTGFAEMDAVFRENGIDQAVTDQRSFAQKKTRRLGEPGNYIELVDMHLSPFPWLAIGNTSWECNKAWHLKDNPYVYPCLDRPDDTFAVSYRVKSKTETTSGSHSHTSQHSLVLKLVMRRYVEADRVVLVYASQSDGENELAGASTSDVGYFVSSNASVLSTTPDSPPVSVLQSCMHICPSGSGNDPKVKSLLSVMTVAFEEDVRFIKHQVDTLLLQQARARSDPFASGVPADQDQYLQRMQARIAF